MHSTCNEVQLFQRVEVKKQLIGYVDNAGGDCLKVTRAIKDDEVALLDCGLVPETLKRIGGSE